MAIRRTRIIIQTDELILIRQDSRIQQQAKESEATAPAAIHHQQKSGEKLGLVSPRPSRPEDLNNKNKKEKKL